MRIFSFVCLFIFFGLAQSLSSIFDNTVQKVCVIGSKPFIIVDPSKTNTLSGASPATARYSGFSIDHAAAMLPYLGTNVVFNYYWSPDGTTGSLMSNGLYSGCIGEVQAGRANFTIGAFTATSARAKAVDFSLAFFEQGYEVLVLKPERTRNQWSFKSPFTDAIWISIFMMSLGVGFFSWLFDVISPYGIPKHEEGHGKHGEGDKAKDQNHENHAEHSPTHKKYAETLNEYLINSLKAIVGMKDSKPQRAWSTRFLLFVYFLFFLVILTIYVAKLVDILTANVIISDIKSVKDINSLGLPWALVGSGAAHDFFLSTNETNYINLKNTYVPYSTIDGAVTGLHTGAVAAIIYDSTVLNYYVDQPYKSPNETVGSCNSLAVGEIFAPNSLAVPIYPGLRQYNIVNLFSNAVLNIQESGYRDTLVQKWYVDYGNCAIANSVLPVNPIDIVDLAGLWYVLLFIIGVGLVFGLFERLLWYYRHHESKSLRIVNHFLGLHEHHLHKDKDTVHSTKKHEEHHH